MYKFSDVVIEKRELLGISRYRLANVLDIDLNIVINFKGAIL